MSLTKQQQGWVKTVSVASGYSYAVLAALVDKESDGKFSWDVNGKKLIALNIEGHRFYKYLTLYAPDKLKEAVAAGLAAKKARVIKVPGSYAGRYEFFERMKALHREAAFMSVSFGVGQIMGENYKAMGFPTAEALYNDAQAGGLNQVRQIVAFAATKPPLVTALHSEDPQGIALYYNGSQYKANQYDTKLEALIRIYSGEATEGDYVDHSALEVQELGYDTIESFQRENGLKVDGVAGKITRDKIVEVRKARKPKAPVKTIAVAATTVVVAPTAVVVAEQAKSVQDIVKSVEPVITTVKSLGSFGPTVVIVLICTLIVGAVGYVLWSRTIGRKSA